MKIFFCKYTLLSFLGLLLTNLLLAQTPENTKNLSDQAADILATNAKYHVVIAVLVVIFIGLVVYGWALHRRLTKLEAKQS